MSERTEQKPEQLSMDFSSPEPVELINSSAPEALYEQLDKQLADLMLELNGEDNATLKNCTLEISKHTREGQIAIPCSTIQQSELLKTKVVGKAGDYKPLILDDGYLYLNRYFSYQQQLAEQIQSRMGQSERSTDNLQWTKERLDHYFKNDDLDEEEINWQQVAAERALSHRFLILSGGPGTGKTTTITRILALLIEQHLLQLQLQTQQEDGRNLRILLAAPTGKAAIRMLDAIREAQQKMDLAEDVLEQMPNHASTIHKLLGYKPDSVQFKHNRNHPLNADVVLVDEASMIDIALMSKLVEAVPAHAKLILIGDKDQLSSVETGSVFADMCEGLSVLSSLSPAGGGLGRGEETNSHIVTLQKNWRFSKDSGIGQLAIAANKGNSTKVLEILKNESKAECSLVSPDKISRGSLPADLLSPWKNYFDVLNNKDSSISEMFEAFNQYRILCALRRGLNGSVIMSSRIETALTKQGYLKSRLQEQNKQQSWYHGRPIMITQNSYSKGLFNGDTGITLIKNGEVKVFFPDGEEGVYKSLAPVRLPAHETTWAMTIHKSQGSEFDEVTLILPHEVMPLLTRQLIYTGITRAKKKVSIVASEAVLSAGVKAEMVRATQIGKMLIDDV